jgi:hypothetical protein
MIYLSEALREALKQIRIVSVPLSWLEERAHAPQPSTFKRICTFKRIYYRRHCCYIPVVEVVEPAAVLQLTTDRVKQRRVELGVGGEVGVVGKVSREHRGPRRAAKRIG